ncbi:Thioredoxin [Spirosomataceae bacterium TFI 002]|nr:Thioredoxin [Spirosomataceae bacterium TFI 002]
MKVFRKLIAILVLLVMDSCQKPPSSSIDFQSVVDTPIENVLQQAAESNKLVFVDLYAVWCGPCKYMDENVFKLPSVINKFSKNFVNYKVDVESFDGVNVSLNYKVNSFPTYLFLDKDGKVVHRLEGMFTEEGLIAEADFALAQMK